MKTPLERTEFLLTLQLEQKTAKVELQEARRGLEEATGKLAAIASARTEVSQLALLMQQEICTFVEETVSLALSSVYGERYSFKVERTVKRDLPQWEFKILKGSVELDPKSDVGGGVLDVASFGLRVVLYVLSRPKAHVLLLDESFRFVRSPEGDLLPRAASMVKHIADMMSVQIILVTHSVEFAEVADQVFVVSQKNGESKVEKI